jgi:hypothetical protein
MVSSCQWSTRHESFQTLFKKGAIQKSTQDISVIELLICCFCAHHIKLIGMQQLMPIMLHPFTNYNKLLIVVGRGERRCHEIFSHRYENPLANYQGARP